MRFYPIFLDLAGRRTLVVGEGAVAERKAAPLREAGAVVVMRPRFDPVDLDGCVLAIGAAATETDLHALSIEAQRRGIPVNVVDRPALGSFIAPAIVDREPVLVAISSAGTAPVLARLLRQRIEASIPPAIGRLAALADSFRDELRRRLPDPAKRRPLLEAAFEGPSLDLLADGRDEDAHASFAAALAGDQASGAAFVIEAPAEADLLTLRAHRLMGQADIVVHDAAVAAAVLAMARRDATVVEAGADAEAVVAGMVADGRRVVRLTAPSSPRRSTSGSP